jgi:hypothetical protein
MRRGRPQHAAAAAANGGAAAARLRAVTRAAAATGLAKGCALRIAVLPDRPPDARAL